METNADKARRLNIRICTDCGKKLKATEPIICQTCFEKPMMDAEKTKGRIKL